MLLAGVHSLHLDLPGPSFALQVYSEATLIQALWARRTGLGCLGFNVGLGLGRAIGKAGPIRGSLGLNTEPPGFGDWCFVHIRFPLHIKSRIV